MQTHPVAAAFCELPHCGETLCSQGSIDRLHPLVGNSVVGENHFATDGCNEFLQIWVILHPSLQLFVLGGLINDVADRRPVVVCHHEDALFLPTET